MQSIAMISVKLLVKGGRDDRGTSIGQKGNYNNGLHVVGFVIGREALRDGTLFTLAFYPKR